MDKNRIDTDVTVTMVDLMNGRVVVGETRELTEQEEFECFDSIADREESSALVMDNPRILHLSTKSNGYLDIAMLPYLDGVSVILDTLHIVAICPAPPTVCHHYRKDLERYGQTAEDEEPKVLNS